MQTIPFVSVVRFKGMKRGLALDKAGKRWRGFTTDRSDEAIRLSGVLGSVGLCWCCRGRVHAGWESLDDQPRRDLCDSCVSAPPAFVIENRTEWRQIAFKFRKRKRA